MNDKIRKAWEKWINGKIRTEDVIHGQRELEVRIHAAHQGFKAGYEAAQPKWLPIAEYDAEKHGKEVLVSGGTCQSICSGSSEWGEAGKDIHLAGKSQGDDFWIVSDYFNIKPTHFMPIAHPPEEK
jgi:hypothetical protein